MINNKKDQNYKYYLKALQLDPLILFVSTLTISILTFSLVFSYTTSDDFRGLNSLNKDTTIIEKDVADLNARYKSLENSLKSIEAENKDIYAVNLRVEELDTKVDNIQETIDQNPNEAVNSILLKKDMEHIEQEIESVKINQQNLSNKIDSTTYTFIGALVVSVFVTVVVAPAIQKNKNT